MVTPWMHTCSGLGLVYLARLLIWPRVCWRQGFVFGMKWVQIFSLSRQKWDHAIGIKLKTGKSREIIYIMVANLREAVPSSDLILKSSTNSLLIFYSCAKRLEPPSSLSQSRKGNLYLRARGARISSRIVPNQTDDACWFLIFLVWQMPIPHVKLFRSGFWIHVHIWRATFNSIIGKSCSSILQSEGWPNWR